jgi:Ni,Fe-hydrogenase I cytochrome b subunit
MIGIWKSYSDVYLYITGVVTLITFGIPLMVVPMSWARVFRWEVPKPENLVVFFGRTLGIFLSVIAVFAFKAAGSPATKPFYFELMLWLFVTMLVLHVYGAIRKTQPITETLEILLWIILILATLCFYPA